MQSKLRSQVIPRDPEANLVFLYEYDPVRRLSLAFFETPHFLREPFADQPEIADKTTGPVFELGRTQQGLGLV